MILTNAFIGFVQLFITVIFSVMALYLGLAIHSKMARTIDAEREILKGNIAVAIVVVAVFIAIAIVVESGVAGLVIGIDKGLEIGIFNVNSLLIVGIALLQLVFGIIFAVGAIFLALKVLEKLASGVFLFEELRDGNVAVALEMAGVIIAVTVIIQSGVLGIISTMG